MKEATNSAVSRRDVLSGIGASVALTAAGSGTAVAAPPEGTELGTRGFNEVLLTYGGAPDVPLGGIDPMAHYQINPEEKQLVLQAPIGKSKAAIFKHNPNIIAFGAIPMYYTPGTTLGGKSSIQPQITGIKHLPMPDGITSPKISTRPGAKQSVVIEAEGQEITVREGETGVLTLDDVSVEYFTGAGEFITTEDREGNPVKTRRSETATTMLTPTITVRNHGGLQVYEPEEVWG